MLRFGEDHDQSYKAHDICADDDLPVIAGVYKSPGSNEIITNSAEKCQST